MGEIGESGPFLRKKNNKWGTIDRKMAKISENCKKIQAKKSPKKMKEKKTSIRCNIQKK